MAVNGIEIEVGQKWRTRGGDEVHIVAHSEAGAFPWISADTESYSNTGSYFGGASQDDYDLIELLEHADGFKPWAGGEQPAETRGKLVTTRFNDGSGGTAPAESYHWGDTYLIAYKVLEEAAAPAEGPGYVGTGQIFVAPYVAQEGEPASDESSFKIELIDDPVNAHALLTAAAKHMADRASTYDKPEGERSMAQTVAVFKAYHGIELTEAQGWHFMQILKDVRLFTRPTYHGDSAEDCIAYAALKAEAKAQEGGE